MLSAHLPHTKCRLPSLFDSFGEAAKDFFGASDPVDLGQTAGFPIKVDERLGLGLIEVKAPINGLRGVVVTLHHVSPTVITAPMAGFLVRGLIVRATVATDPTNGKPRQDKFARHNKIYCKVKGAVGSCLVK